MRGMWRAWLVGTLLTVLLFGAGCDGEIEPTGFVQVQSSTAESPTKPISGLEPLMQVASYGSLPSSRFPPDGWRVQTPFDSSGWPVLDVTKAADVGSANVISPNTPSIDAAAKLEAIAASSTSGRVLYFPAGVYYLETDLGLTSSSLVIRGAGQGVTQFRISAPPSANAEFRFQGAGPGPEMDVVNEPTRGQSSFEYSGGVLAAGDVVQIYDNARSYAYGRRNYSQMAAVVSVSGSTVTLDMPLGLTFDGDPKVRRLDMLRNVGVENLTVIRDEAAANANTQNIELNHVFRGYVRNVESANLERSGIALFASLDVLAASNRVHTAFDYGEGGQAYGVHASTGTTRCNLVDNKVWEMRHHIIVDMGANHCVIAYNSAESPYLGTTGDLNHHGFTPHNNLWEGNMGLYLKWDARSEPGGAENQGLYNTAYRNRLLGTNNRVLIEDPDDTGNFPQVSPTVIGNVYATAVFGSGVVDRFVGANRVNGSVVWGSASSSWTYPASLFTDAKPAYLGSTAWPTFGPGVGSDFGATNTIPAYARPRAVSGGYITDNNTANYSDSGDWGLGPTSLGYGGSFRQDGATGGGKWAVFRSPSKPAGSYRVYLYWTANANRATNATVRIYHAAGAFTNANGRYDDFSVNMQSGSSAGQFNPIGGVFTMSSADYVGILNTGANGYVISDAVQLVPQ